MTDGQLKKQVKELIKLIDATDSTELYSKVAKTQNDLVCSFIDEAKKDFPKFKIIHDSDFENIMNEKAFLWDSREFNNETVTKWFLKWFGE